MGELQSLPAHARHVVAARLSWIAQFSVAASIQRKNMALPSSAQPWTHPVAMPGFDGRWQSARVAFDWAMTKLDQRQFFVPTLSDQHRRRCLQPRRVRKGPQQHVLSILSIGRVRSGRKDAEFRQTALDVRADPR